jgi:hypothetical protein
MRPRGEAFYAAVDELNDHFWSMLDLVVGALKGVNTIKCQCLDATPIPNGSDSERRILE